MAEQKNMRQHILEIGKVLIAGKGFSAVGLTELLSTAGVPKGSFYHYFKSKEAFGEALLQDYFENYCCRLQEQLFPVASTRNPADAESIRADHLVTDSNGHVVAADGKNMRMRLLDYWQSWMVSDSVPEMQTKCLVGKLSGEVCDLSENMRLVFEAGTHRVIDVLANAIATGIQEGSLSADINPETMATGLYELWLGAILMTKIRHDGSAFAMAMQITAQLLSGVA